MKLGQSRTQCRIENLTQDRARIWIKTGDFGNGQRNLDTKLRNKINLETQINLEMSILT